MIRIFLTVGNSRTLDLTNSCTSRFHAPIFLIIKNQLFHLFYNLVFSTNTKQIIEENDAIAIDEGLAKTENKEY